MKHNTILICGADMSYAQYATGRVMRPDGGVTDTVIVIDSLPGPAAEIHHLDAPDPIMFDDRLAVNYNFGPYKDGKASRRERRQKQRNGNR